MRRRPRQHAGFTIIELMVAMSILGLMLFLINQLFQSSQIAVGTAVQQSKALATGRIVEEQMREDFAEMFGPADATPGYIVIINRRLNPNNNGVAFVNTQTLVEFRQRPFTRDDQIVFVRSADGLRSMTPMNPNTYGTRLAGGTGDVATVWYGLVERTEQDGSSRDPGDASSRIGGANAGFDRVGSDFILGRHTMLFNPADSANGDRVSTTPAAYTHADSPYIDSPVRNATGFSGTNKPAATFMGLTDVCLWDYQTSRSVERPFMQYITGGNTAVENDNYLRTVFASQRLRVNPAPTNTDYESWAVAQTHGIFAPNCSEFVVQFAADLDGNGRLDTTGTNDEGGAILWYDAFNTNTGTVNWATNGWQNPSTGMAQPYYGTVNGDINTRAFIFRVNDDEPYDPVTAGAPDDHSCWPYLIRIRYRLHDTRGRLAGNNPAALTDGIDNDGDGATDEPGEDQIPGQWYEHVFRVPRPAPQ